jgi:hypothetical protein
MGVAEAGPRPQRDKVPGGTVSGSPLRDTLTAPHAGLGLATCARPELAGVARSAPLTGLGTHRGTPLQKKTPTPSGPGHPLPTKIRNSADIGVFCPRFWKSRGVLEGLEFQPPIPHG